MSGIRVLVSGSDGRIGRATVKELRAHGYDVTPADLNPTQPWDTQIVDFTDLGQVVGVMQGHEAVVHLAAIPSPDFHTAEVVFRTNVVSTFNVLEAAAILGIKNITMASSISALGYAFRHRLSIPGICQLMKRIRCFRRIVTGSRRWSARSWRTVSCGGYRHCRWRVCVYGGFDESAQSWLPAARDSRRTMCPLMAPFWTFVDVRDAASACRLALEYEAPGHQAYYICAPIIYRPDDIRELMEKHFPGDYPLLRQSAAAPARWMRARRSGC